MAFSAVVFFLVLTIIREAKFLSNNKQFDERYDDYQTGPPNKQQPQQQQQQQGGGKNPSSYATSSQGTGQGSKPSPPTSTSPTYAGPTPPTSTSPTPSGPTPPTSTSPTPSGPTPPTSTSPTPSGPTPPTSTSTGSPTPPTSTSPTPSGPTPPTSTSPTPSGPTPPTSTSPGTGGTGPTNIGWHGTGYGGSPWALMYNPYRTTPTAYSVSPQDSFAVQVLMAHNYYRSMHGVQPLLLDPNMNQYAQQWANHLAMVGSLDHRPNNPYGENLYKGWSTNPNFQMNGARPVNAWYSEIVYYEYGTEPINNFAAVGHSTQVLWASSQRLGVGQAKQGNTIFVVCNYDPAGNQFGYFAQNVVQPGVGFRMTRPYGNDMLTAYGLPAGQRRRNYAFNQLMLPSGLSTAGAGGGMGAGLNGNMGLNPNLAMNNGAGLNGNMGMNPNLALNSNMGLNSGQVPNMQQYPPAAPGAGGGLGAGANAGINGLGMNANLNLGSRGGAGGGAGLPPAPPGPQGAPGGLSIGANANTNLLPLGGQTLISVG